MYVYVCVGGGGGLLDGGRGWKRGDGVIQLWIYTVNPEINHQH